MSPCVSVLRSRYTSFLSLNFSFATRLAAHLFEILSFFEKGTDIAIRWTEDVSANRATWASAAKSRALKVQRRCHRSARKYFTKILFFPFLVAYSLIDRQLRWWMPTEMQSLQERSRMPPRHRSVLHPFILFLFHLSGILFLFTGQCRCLPGWKGDDCSVPCPANTWGIACAQRCTCLHNGTCRPNDGQCRCHDGWMGPQCNESETSVVFWIFK